MLFFIRAAHILLVLMMILVYRIPLFSKCTCKPNCLIIFTQCLVTSPRTFCWRMKLARSSIEFDVKQHRYSLTVKCSFCVIYMEIFQCKLLLLFVRSTVHNWIKIYLFIFGYMAHFIWGERGIKSQKCKILFLFPK